MDESSSPSGLLLLFWGCLGMPFRGMRDGPFPEVLGDNRGVRPAGWLIAHRKKNGAPRGAVPGRSHLTALYPFITPTCTLRKRVGAAPCAVCATCPGCPFPQFTVPQTCQ